jgi:hypothetical protein
VAGVGVTCLAVVVVRRLVDEDGEELVDQWIDEPFLSRGLGSGDEACAAPGFGREEIALDVLVLDCGIEFGETNLPGLVGVEIWSSVCVHPLNCFCGGEVLDDGTAIVDDSLYDPIDF